MNNEKPLVIYSILKWYGVIMMTLAGALSLIAGVDDSDMMIIFVLNLPLAVYMWSLVARKLT